jgi:hypothetical protein
MTAEGRNDETATDSMVTHVHNTDVSCWSTPSPYSNRIVRVSLVITCQQCRSDAMFGPPGVI